MGDLNQSILFHIIPFMCLRKSQFWAKVQGYCDATRSLQLYQLSAPMARSIMPYTNSLSCEQVLFLIPRLTPPLHRYPCSIAPGGCRICQLEWVPSFQRRLLLYQLPLSSFLASQECSAADSKQPLHLQGCCLHELYGVSKGHV